jgi:hypothetical protein
VDGDFPSRASSSARLIVSSSGITNRLSALRCGLDVAASLWGIRRANFVVAAAVTAAESSGRVQRLPLRTAAATKERQLQDSTTAPAEMTEHKLRVRSKRWRRQRRFFCANES